MSGLGPSAGGPPVEVCALIDDRIICMHGGLSPELKHFDQRGPKADRIGKCKQKVSKANQSFGWQKKLILREHLLAC